MTTDSGVPHGGGGEAERRWAGANRWLSMGPERRIDVGPNIIGVCEEEVVLAAGDRRTGLACSIDPVPVSATAAVILCVVVRALLRTIVRSRRDDRLDVSVRLWRGAGGAAELSVGAFGEPVQGEDHAMDTAPEPSAQPGVVWVRRVPGRRSWRVTFREEAAPL